MYNLFEQFGVQELAPQEQREVFGGGWLDRFKEVLGDVVDVLMETLTHHPVHL